MQGGDDFFDDVNDAFINDLFNMEGSFDSMPSDILLPVDMGGAVNNATGQNAGGFQAMRLITEAPPITDVDGPNSNDHAAPNRKRRAPDQVALDVPVVGRLNVPTQEMEKMLTFRVEHATPTGVVSHAVTAREELVKLTQICKAQTGQVEQLRQAQFNAIQQSSLSMLQNCQGDLTRLEQVVRQELSALDTLQNLVLLEGAEMFQSRFLESHFRLLLAHCKALINELVWVANGCPLDENGCVPIHGGLVIKEQPESCVVFKGKALDDPYTIELVNGVRDPVNVYANAWAELVSPNSESAGKGLENNEVAMDSFRKQGVFHHLRPVVSARMSTSTIKFGVMVVAGTNNQPTKCESPETEPLLVITHESQWGEAVQRLLLQDAFKFSSKTISWQRFANLAHAHYFRASKQDLKNVSRKLTMTDFHYIFNRFFASSYVNGTQASTFLKWFGPVLQALRFKKHIRPMWFQGLIFGFIDKENCNRTLAAFEEGTFLIRFSESNPGYFAVAYVSDDVHDRVKHYLVKQEDFSPNKTLADVIHSKPQWIHLLRLDISNGTLTKYPKDKVLAPFYTGETQVLKKQNGYVIL